MCVRTGSELPPAAGAPDWCGRPHRNHSVSGYFHTGDANMASHAWADVWLGEEQGWFSLDITNAKPANNHYCRLAVGRDYLNACPVRGVRRGGGEEAMSVRVYVGASADQ